MTTEKITLLEIQNRTSTDYDFIRSADPLTGYDDATGPPDSTIDSVDITGITLDVTTFFPGRLCRPEFRLSKDFKVLANIVANLDDPTYPGPKKFILVSSSDPESGYLEDKITDSEGILITKIEDSSGFESLQLDIRVKNSIEIDLDILQLVGDQDTPGNLKFYGTNDVGSKGWYDFALTETRVSITAADTTPGYLDDKITDGGAVSTTVVTDSTGNQTLDFSILTKKSIHVSADFLALEMLEFINDESVPGNSKFYGTSTVGTKGWQSLPIKNSIEEDSAQLQFINDESVPGNSKFYGTSTVGVKGWQSLPVKKSLEENGNELQLSNDETLPGNSKYYGTDLGGNKGWHIFSASAGATVSITVGDVGSGYLDDKVTDGDGILTAITMDSLGEQLLDFSVLVKNSIEIDSDYLQLINDENAPGNSKFYGTSTVGTKGWQSLPIKNSIEEDSAQLQLLNDESVPGTLHYYGTNVAGAKGWYGFTEVPIPGVTISNTDTSADYLDPKVSAGDGIFTTIITDSTGEQQLDFSVLTKNSIEIDSDYLQFINDESVPGNSKFYGTTTVGVKGWQLLPIKNSIEQDSEKLQLTNDENIPGNDKYYGTNDIGTKGFFDLPSGSTVAISITDLVPGYLDEKLEGQQSVVTTKESDSALDEILGITLLNDINAPGNLKYYGTDETGIKGWHDREYFPNELGLGGLPDIESIGNDFPILRRCSIHPNTGALSNIGISGDDVVFSGNGTSADQQAKAAKFWNSVWNDIADFQELNDKLVYGKCYYDTINGAAICNIRCQESVIGIASNTFGYALGADKDKVPIAVSGWVLAFVDKEYRIGIPLTNNKYGTLTEISIEEKQKYPERIVAIYKKKETKEFWGPKGKEIEVNSRHWVKVK